MPCNKLAVANAVLQLSEALVKATYTSVPVLEGLAQVMNANFAGEHFTVWNDQPAANWHHGYRNRNLPPAEQQVVPLSIVAATAGQYVDICSTNLALRICANGTIEARDPWRYGYRDPRVEQAMDLLGQALLAYAAQTAQGMLVDALQSAGAVLTAVQQQATATVYTFEV